MRRTGKILCAAFAVLYILTAFPGCAKDAGAPPPPGGAAPPFATYRDVPDVTDEEIAAIEALRQSYDSVVYGMPQSIEAFRGEDGGIRGFTAFICDWLSELFGIRFEPVQYEWLDVLAGLDSGAVHFTGEMRATDERKKTYIMTDDPIAERVIKSYRYRNSPSLQEISASRLIRYALIEGSANTVLNYLEPGTYELTYVGQIDQIPDMLINGEIDAYLHSSAGEANFIGYADVVADYFFPLISSPVSLTAKDRAFEPVIAVMQKVLRHGGRDYLAQLYEDGYNDYRRHKLFIQLTEEERGYIADNPVVNFIAEIDNYPISFYNTHEGMWQGIAHEVLREVESVTGLTFEIVNSKDGSWPVFLDMLERGEASIVSELVRTDAREGRFLWTETPIMKDYTVLVSKSDHPHIDVNDILNLRVGTQRNTVFGESFRRWFPDHQHLIEYDNIDDILEALDRGEVDMMMGRTNQYLASINYRELFGYKINFVFNSYLETVFGFNKHERVLCSIVDKALKLIDAESISLNWTHRVYDYRYKVIEARTPLLIGTTALSLVILTLILVLLLRSRSEGRRLERLVAEQTAELKDTSEEAKSASEAKSRFIANMSHEMRTPMNVVVGLTDLMLEEDDPANVKENLQKINTAGNTLMGLINDVLDISKIEAGKLELMPDQYDVASNINDIVTLNLIRIEDKPVTFQLNVGEDLHSTMCGDDLRVKQILNNLLSNAFKYTRRGTVTLSIGSRREGEHLWVDLTISDTGIGIKQEDMRRLFDDYNQVDTRANRKIEGTGLGLSITKRLVELMDGSMSVESEYGKGTTFRVRIRQGFVSDAVIGAETVKNLCDFHYLDNRERVKLARSDLSYARVLLVDDFPTNLDVAAGMLRKYKMQVDCLDNGQDAVTRIGSGKPVYDAVFMDHMMPGMDGMEATTLIRALGTRYAENVPIIALTANAVAGNEQMFLDNGFSAYLPKPINVMTLDGIVQRWVRDKAKEGEA